MVPLQARFNHSFRKTHPRSWIAPFCQFLSLRNHQYVGILMEKDGGHFSCTSSLFAMRTEFRAHKLYLLTKFSIHDFDPNLFESIKQDEDFYW